MGLGKRLTPLLGEALHVYYISMEQEECVARDRWGRCQGTAHGCHDIPVAVPLVFTLAPEILILWTRPAEEACLTSTILTHCCVTEYHDSHST